VNRTPIPGERFSSIRALLEAARARLAGGLDLQVVRAGPVAERNGTLPSLILAARQKLTEGGFFA
jgi:hypothetical protein